MNRRTFIHRVGQGAAGYAALRHLAACRAPAAPAASAGASGTDPAANRSGPDAELRAARDRYFLRTLELNPVMSTYLGGDGYSPALAGINGRLRDLGPIAVRAEIEFLRGVTGEMERIDPARLSPDARIDRELILAQAGYVLHQLADRAYHERSIENYASEPFRGVDWQLQQMTAADQGHLGTEPEWRDVIARARELRGYLETAQANLRAGVAAGNRPDRRMVEFDGIRAATASATYFRTTLPGLADKYLGARPFAGTIRSALSEASEAAATAYTRFADFLRKTYDPRDRADRYAAGEKEYEWRVRHCLRDTRTAEQLFAYGAEQVALYEDKMFRVADELARAARLTARPTTGTPAERRAGVRQVIDHLNRDAPKSDAELFAWYRSAAERAVAYGREHGLFDIPTEYRLDIVEMPEVLGGGASYYPAPPFKKSGVGRFYLGATGGDPAKLAQQSRASVPDTAVHEGFPGHDWHYKYLTQHAAEISNIRWLTPGAVEDCFSMWEDSMATEGWGLYAEELMAEPTPGRPYGFYDAAEYLFMLQGQLLRAVRIRVDVGIHTGRMTYDDAVDTMAEHVGFYAKARQRTAAGDPIARAVFEDAEQAIYRYSKWPTQAITYNLGKTAIAQLRADIARAAGASFDGRAFHERFMRMGTIPTAYFRDLFLEARPA